MKNIDPGWLGWAAGILDGEGCLQFCRRPGGKSYTLRIHVFQLDGRMLVKLRDMFGGTIQPVARNHKNPRERDGWRWYLTAAGADQCLRLVLPWLVVKQEQAELILIHRERYVYAPGKHGSRPLSSGRLSAQEWAYRRLRELKREVPLQQHINSGPKPSGQLNLGD